MILNFKAKNNKILGKRSTLSIIYLLLYSLSPGFAKIYNSEIFFIAGFCFALLFIFTSPKYTKTQCGIQQNSSHASLIFYYALIVFFISLVSGVLSNALILDAAFLGVGLFFIPFILGFLLSRCDAFFVMHSFAIVGVINCAIAFLIYPPIQLVLPSFLNEISAIVTDGSAAFRMTSVSGSLAFGSLSLVTFISFYYFYNSGNKFADLTVFYYFRWLIISFLFLAVLLSLQRSAWIGVFLFILLFFAGRKLIKFAILLLLVFALVYFLPNIKSWIPIENFDVFLEIFFDRMMSLFFSTETSMFAERSGQWSYLLKKISSYPLGIGFGQVGQATRIVNNDIHVEAILDGDYFRLLSEFGILSIPLVILILTAPLRIFYIRYKNGQHIYFYKMLSIIMLVLSLQLIGTNVTEMYFVNTIFWFIFFTHYRFSGF